MYGSLILSEWRHFSQFWWHSELLHGEWSYDHFTGTSVWIGDALLHVFDRGHAPHKGVLNTHMDWTILIWASSTEDQLRTMYFHIQIWHKSEWKKYADVHTSKNSWAASHMRGKARASLHSDCSSISLIKCSLFHLAFLCTFPTDVYSGRGAVMSVCVHGALWER